jgi:ParB-like chromosome segregation protein Spo0J
MQTYEFHEIANAYPMMDKLEFDNLVNNIAENGYDEKQPIYLYENKILDGRNRYNACMDLEIEPIYVTFEGTYEKAIESSRQLNSYRRNMSKSQKAMCAAYEIVQCRDAEGRSLSVAKAAMIYGVSKRYVEDAIQILGADEPIAKLVFDGKKSIYQAKSAIESIEQIRNAASSDQIEYEQSNYTADRSIQSSRINESIPLEGQCTISNNTTQDNYITELEEENEMLKQQLEECMRRCAEY